MATDVFFYPSSGEESYFEQLRRLIAKYPHDIRHHLDLFPVYTSRRAFIRQLAHYELFKMTIDLPGHYIDFGVYFGKSFFTWHKFLEIFTPTATHKKVIGFDTFVGFPNLVSEDGKNDSAIQKEPGGLSSASFLDEFLELLDLHNQDAVLPAGRGTIIQGDVCKTFPQWLDKNPEARFCLCNLDLDLYEPTAVVLENSWDRIVPGGILVLDEYGTSKWPGETKAWDDFAARRCLNIALKRFPFANAPGAFLIKH
jgi:Macrocin-O-methyltransferase (TylF)